MKSIGRYQVEEQIGRGGMGVVYRCTDPALGRTVAAKILASHLLSNDANTGAAAAENIDGSTITPANDALARFQREATLSAQLAHPNIATLYDYGDVSGHPYYVMTWIDGRSLRRVISEDGPLPPSRAQKLLAQLVDALDYAHGQGVLHRDLKPSNILLDEQDTATIIDFGLARLQEASDLTAPQRYRRLYSSKLRREYEWLFLQTFRWCQCVVVTIHLGLKKPGFSTVRRTLWAKTAPVIRQITRKREKPGFCTR